MIKLQRRRARSPGPSVTFGIGGACHEDPVLLVDDPNGERGLIDRDLAEVIETSSRKQSLGSEVGVDRGGFLQRGGERSGSELVEREGRRRAVPDQISIVDVRHEDDEVADSPFAPRVQKSISLGREPGPEPQESSWRPGVSAGPPFAIENETLDTTIFQTAFDAATLSSRPLPLGSPEDRLVRAVEAARASILARVEDEDFEEGAPPNSPIETRRLLLRRPDRPVVEEGA
jgi:hypothetical protein